MKIFTDCFVIKNKNNIKILIYQKNLLLDILKLLVNITLYLWYYSTNLFFSKKC